MIKFGTGKIISLAQLIEDKEWDALKEIREQGQPSYSKSSVGYSYRGSYYVLKGTIQYGEEIKIGKRDCGCRSR